MKWLRRLLGLDRTGDVYVVVDTWKSPFNSIYRICARKTAADLCAETMNRGSAGRFIVVNRDIIGDDDA